MEDYLKPCQYSIRLVEKLNSLDLKNDLDFKLVDKAIYWAKKYHNGQFRKSGEPFYSHPLEVAYMISDHLLHTNTIVASILHDIVEDTEVTIGMILDEFGWRVLEIDGHDISAIRGACDKARACTDKPTIVLAHTTSPNMF